MTMETVTSRVLHEASVMNGGHQPTNLNELPRVPRDIPMVKPPVDTQILLRDDLLALDLAKQQSADILVPETVLRAMIPFLLGQSSSASGSLLLGLTRPTNHTNLLVIDEPLFVSHANPRQALDCAHQYAVHHWLAGGNASHPPLYRFTLLEFPRPPKQPLRILVRSHVSVCWENRPLHVSTRMEFFPERGRHLASDGDRAGWILNHWLKHHSVIGRIDPCTGQALAWEHPSLAFALTAATNESIERQLAGQQLNTVTTDPLDCWKSCAHFLASLTTVGSGSHVASFPASEIASQSGVMSASVHAPDETGELDVKALQQAQVESVLQTNSWTQSDVLLQCFQYWEWTMEDRVPYTFPSATK